MARNSGGGFGTWFYGFLVGGVIGVGSDPIRKKS